MQKASELGIINMDDVKQQIEMIKRKELLEKHPYKITEGKDGYWRTYIPKADGGRRLIKKKNERDIQNEVIAYWEAECTNKFSSRFEIWIERQRACGRSENTIYKYEKDYERFIAGDPIEEMDIRVINEETISIFIDRLLGRKEVPWRALKGLFGYLNGTFEKAIIDGIIDKNPCRRVDLPIYKKKCVEVRRKTDAERTVSKNERKILLDKFRKDDSIEKYAVELSFLTGMRVGEIAGLEWVDVNFEKGIITVCHSEKFNQTTKVRTIEGTKTGKSRQIPITDSIKRLLFTIRDFELKRGTLGEYVFMNEKDRLTARQISHSVYNKTRSSEFSSTKSIHAIRRTLNSNMRCNGVSRTVAAALLGHSETVNDRNYTYDTSSMEEKKSVLDTAAGL